MNSVAILPKTATRNWKHLVEAVILETGAENFSQRIQDALDAIMDEIEDTFHTASQAERQSLTNALNSVRELRRVGELPKSQVESRARDRSVA
jgi:hypothetical protein